MAMAIGQQMNTLKIQNPEEVFSLTWNYPFSPKQLNSFW
jgi:hypothetical protein